MAQLVMWRPDLDNLGVVNMPKGYLIRTYREGDEEAWAEIVRVTFGGDWDADRCRSELTGCRQFKPDGLFFASYNERLVGTACAWTQSPDETVVGYLHMVGVSPEHQGKRLGYSLCLSTLHFFKQNGFKCVKLNTDDFRLPAVKTYLNLGFKPRYPDESHEERWKAVFEKLGIEKR